jgi:cytochrome c peroxidase
MRTIARRWTEASALPPGRPRGTALPKPLLVGGPGGWGTARRRSGAALAAVVFAGGLAAGAAAAPFSGGSLPGGGPPDDAAARAAALSPASLAAGAAQKTPAGDDLVELGRRLFFDPGASHSKRASCASCHDPAHGYSDPAVVSADDFGATARHSQPLLDLAPAKGLHWDGEFASVEDLVMARTGATRTRFSGSYDGAGRSDSFSVTPIADALAASGHYASAFEAAFGDPKPTRERIAMAVAWYVRSLRSTENALDRRLAGDAKALSPSAERGLELFKGRAGCASCHSFEGERPLLTDGRFHVTGVARRHGRRRANLPNGEDLGRGLVSKKDHDHRAFKTPSLRDVALRAPYMHDGSFPTLEAVVRYYATECGSVTDERLDPALAPFAAGRPAAEVEADVRDLVAFLGALTGETRAGLATEAWSRRPEKIRLRLLAPGGAPYAGPVVLTPAGDAVPSSEGSPERALHLLPDAEGWVEAAPPPTTHFAVSLPGANLRPAAGPFVPDTCREGTVALEAGPPHAGIVQNGFGGGRRKIRSR